MKINNPELEKIIQRRKEGGAKLNAGQVRFGSLCSDGGGGFAIDIYDDDMYECETALYVSSSEFEEDLATVMNDLPGLIVPLKRDRRLRDKIMEYQAKGYKVSTNPMVISGYRSSSIVTLDINEKGATIVGHVEFNTYGASVNKISLCLLKTRRTIPDHVFDQIQDFDDYDFIAMFFGDSVEKILTLKSKE